jgi:hypothetical protein
MVVTKVIGLEELHIKLTEGVPLPVKRMMFKVRGHALKRAKEAAKPHSGDTGALANALKASVATSGKIALSARVFTNLPIAREVEEGRRGGSKPPTFRSIQRWAKRHGIDASPKNIRLLRRAIARRTEGVHFMESAGEDTLVKLPEWVIDAEREIKAGWDK